MSTDNVEDLIALARRRQLGEPAARRLQMVLHTSTSARVLHDVGSSFDEARTERAGDAELLARVTERVRARLDTKPAPATSKRRQRWMIAAVGFLIAGSAAASAIRFQWFDSGAGPHSGAPATQASAPTSPHATSSHPTLTAPAEPLARSTPEQRGPENTGAESTPTPASAASSSGLGHAHARAAAPAKTAEALFKAGNDARKAGRQASALATYRQLQRSFPGSPEARLSQVLSGRMLLAMGRTGAALDQFESYLRGGGHGGLAEEALWGKAQALSRLGRSSEEQRVWRTLLARFPKSVYAATARQRLER